MYGDFCSGKWTHRRQSQSSGGQECGVTNDCSSSTDRRDDRPEKCPCIQDVFDMTETFEKMGGESSGQEDCLVLEGKNFTVP